MKKHILNLGLNDKDSKLQEITTLDAYKIAFNCLKKHYSGGTITEGRGFYTHENGQIVFETSLIITILYAEDKKTLALIEDLKVLFNQESILFEAIETNASFI